MKNIKVSFGKDLLGNNRVGLMRPDDATNALQNGAKITLGCV
jgi:hypothetical protein